MPFFIRLVRKSKLLVIPFVLMLSFTTQINPGALMGYLSTSLVKQCHRTNCDMLQIKFTNPNLLKTNLQEDKVNTLQSRQLWLYGQAPKSSQLVELQIAGESYQDLDVDKNGHFYVLLDLPQSASNFDLTLLASRQSINYKLEIAKQETVKPKLISFCEHSLTQGNVGQTFETPIECERNSLNLKLTQAKADYFEVFWNSVLYGSLALNNTENQVVTIQAPDKVVNHLSQNQVHRVTLLPKEFEVYGEPDPEIIYYKILE